MTGARCGSMTPSPLRWRLLSWTTPPQADLRGQLVEDWRADDHSDFEVLALRRRLLGVDASTMGRAGHIEPALVLGAEHGSVETPIIDARIRIPRNDEIII